MALRFVICLVAGYGMLAGIFRLSAPVGSAGFLTFLISALLFAFASGLIKDRYLK